MDFIESLKISLSMSERAGLVHLYKIIYIIHTPGITYHGELYDQIVWITYAKPYITFQLA